MLKLPDNVNQKYYDSIHKIDSSSKQQILIMSNLRKKITDDFNKCCDGKNLSQGMRYNLLTSGITNNKILIDFCLELEERFTNVYVEVNIYPGNGGCQIKRLKISDYKPMTDRFPLAIVICL